MFWTDVLLAALGTGRGISLRNTGRAAWSCRGCSIFPAQAHCRPSNSPRASACVARQTASAPFSHTGLIRRLTCAATAGVRGGGHPHYLFQRQPLWKDHASGSSWRRSAGTVDAGSAPGGTEADRQVALGKFRSNMGPMPPCPRHHRCGRCREAAGSSRGARFAENIARPPGKRPGGT